MANWVVYHNWILRQWNGNAIDLDTDTLKVGILKSTYTPAAATDTDWSTISSGKEVSGTNYSAGGATVASPTVTLSSGTVTFDFADITIAQSGAGFTDGRIAVLYKSADSKLIAYNDFGADKGNVAGDLILQLDSLGCLTIS